jgi:hypothetical protein
MTMSVGGTLTVTLWLNCGVAGTQSHHSHHYAQRRVKKDTVIGIVRHVSNVVALATRASTSDRLSCRRVQPEVAGIRQITPSAPF